jgi:hypothetical protein
MNEPPERIDTKTTARTRTHARTHVSRVPPFVTQRALSVAEPKGERETSNAFSPRLN